MAKTGRGDRLDGGAIVTVHRPNLKTRYADEVLEKDRRRAGKTAFDGLVVADGPVHQIGVDGQPEWQAEAFAQH